MPVNTRAIRSLLDKAISKDVVPINLLSKRAVSHIARLARSKRLKLTYRRLQRGPATTRQMAKYTGSEAVRPDVHELRQNLKPAGGDILCKYQGLSDEGRKIYLYTLVEGKG